MICDHWQIAAVPFPFMERPAVKRRPALIVSNRNFNSNNDHTIMAMITTAQLERWSSDYTITETGRGRPANQLLCKVESFYAAQQLDRACYW